MSTVTGAMTTTSVLSNQLAIDLGKEISLLEPDVQPLAVFSRAVQKEATIATKFKWLEDEAKARFDTVATETAAGGTTIPVANGTYYQQWDQVLNTRTGEQVRVDSVNANTLTVTRGIGSTAATMLVGDELMIIGSAQPENDTSKPARAKQPSLVENYTQIFRTPFEVSGTLQAVGFMAQPKEWNRVARNAGIEHAKDIEYSFLLGRKSATTPGATEDRTTGGVLSFITSNQTDAGGNLSEAEFGAAVAQVMRYGSKSKLAMGSATAVQALNKFPASKQITKNDETTYGMDVTHYTSPFGSLNLVYHRLLEGQKYGGYLVIVDMQQTWYRHLANDEISRDTKVLANRQPNDQDGTKSELLTECGLRFGLQRTHGLISGITS
jgi:Family of unknown function (DUF5309)